MGNGYFVVLWFMFYNAKIGTSITVTISGSRIFPVKNQPFTFTCTFTSNQVAVKELHKNGIKVQSVQLSTDGPNKCYNVQLAKPSVCDPSFCSCSQQGELFTARWTLPSVNDAVSTWTCVEAASKSLELVLKAAVHVPSVHLDGISGTRIPIIDGVSKSLTCVTEASRPRAYVSWYIGDSNFTSNSNSTIINGQDEMTTIKSVMTFTPKKDQNNSTVNCKAYNIDPDVTVELVTKPTLDLQYGPENPIILNPSTLNYTVNETDQFGPIKCSAICNPNCNYTWIYSGITYAIGDTLLIRNINRAQAGAYRCLASNSISSKQSNDVILIVHYAAKVTSMTIDGGIFTISEHSTKVITCTAEGQPPPMLTLRYVSNDTVIARLNGGFKLDYSFPPARCEDTGKYKCEVDKFSSNRSIQKDIFVLCAPRIVNSTDFEIFRNVKQTLEITATFIAYPQPNISWLFQKKNEFVERELGSGFHTSSTGLFHTTHLQKNRIDNVDYGKYSVVASNVLGVNRNIFTVNAKGPPSDPADFEAFISTETAISLQWQSGFNGGSQQSFHILYKLSNKRAWMSLTKVFSDKGNGKCQIAKIENLLPNTLYIFQLYAVNLFGNSSSIYTNFTTKPQDTMNDKPSSVYQTGVALCVIGSLLIIAAVCIAIFVFRKLRNRKTKKVQKKSETTYSDLGENRATVNVYDELSEKNGNRSNRLEEEYENTSFRD